VGGCLLMLPGLMLAPGAQGCSDHHASRSQKPGGFVTSSVDSRQTKDGSLMTIRFSSRSDREIPPASQPGPVLAKGVRQIPLGTLGAELERDRLGPRLRRVAAVIRAAGAARPLLVAEAAPTARRGTELTGLGAPSRHRLHQLPWPLRSVAAGTSGTAALGLAYAIERHVRRSPRGVPLDYDDSDVPGKIVVSILHLGQVTERDDMELGAALRWSYGSAFGLWHGVLRRHVREPWASLGFGTTLMTATFSLFPLLGRTPVPRRWPKGYIASCVFTHAAYVITVGHVDSNLRDVARSEGSPRPEPTR
jgi:hypothetical protein